MKLKCHSVQFSSVAQSCPTLCDPMNCSTPGLPVHHQLPEFTQTHVHRVGDAIQQSHTLSSPSPPAPQPLPASGSFPMGQLFAWGGQSIGVSASASVFPMNTQDWSPLGYRNNPQIQRFKEHGSSLDYLPVGRRQTETFDSGCQRHLVLVFFGQIEIVLKYSR